MRQFARFTQKLQSDSAQTTSDRFAEYPDRFVGCGAFRMTGCEIRLAVQRLQPFSKEARFAKTIGQRSRDLVGVAGDHTNRTMSLHRGDFGYASRRASESIRTRVGREISCRDYFDVCIFHGF